jgi:phosphoserine phosphatase
MTLRLALFDLDGTLKQARNPYTYLHRRLGTLEASHASYERAMAGEIEYEELLRLNVVLWKGVSRARMEALCGEIPYLPGARETVRALQQAGVLIAIVSTGLDVHARQVGAELGADRVFANQILFESGVATGVARLCVPRRGKGQIVAQLQAEYGLEPGECLATGDMPPDADMFARVRVGVAVSPEADEVRAAADLVLEEPDLRPLLPGLRERLPGWIPG